MVRISGMRAWSVAWSPGLASFGISKTTESPSTLCTLTPPRLAYSCTAAASLETDKKKHSFRGIKHLSNGQTMRKYKGKRERKEKNRKKQRKRKRDERKCLLFNYHSPFFCSCSPQSWLSDVCILSSSCSSLTHSSRRPTSTCSRPLQCSRLEMAAVHCWTAKRASNCQNKHVTYLTNRAVVKNTISQSELGLQSINIRGGYFGSGEFS